MLKGLSPDKGLIFRITHRDNLAWILENGLHCQTSKTIDPNFISIGNAELIERRRNREVPIPPGGMLSDYVPFYFTPYSPMMLNVRTGWGGIIRRENAEIAILVSSMGKLQKMGMPFTFTDRHAYLEAAEFYSDLQQLDCIDWAVLQNRDFKRDPNDPEKVERYQAEALVFRHVPAEALSGVVCYTEAIANQYKEVVSGLGLTVDVKAVPKWYF